MIIVDSNVFVYAVNTRAEHHLRTRRWLEEALSGNETVGLAWMALMAFARLTTGHTVLAQPLPIEEAFSLIDDWLTAPASRLVQPTNRHASTLRALLVEAGKGGNLVADGHLAALAVEHDARICTFDRDFARFPGVQVFAPG